MTTFDDRDKAFENKFAHDEELTFKATSLCNRLLGLWAAEKMGKSGADAESYATSIIDAEFGGQGHKAIEDKLIHDLTAANVPVTLKVIHHEAARLRPIARKRVMGIQE